MNTSDSMSQALKSVRADILIRGARVCDGTGRPWFPANVALKGDRISAVGSSVNQEAACCIDARGLVLAPGFIDVHTHADRGVISHPAAENLVRQGITSVIGGNCGSSVLPVRAHLNEVDKARPAVNYGTLAGHGSIRRSVMGMAAGRPTRKQLDSMRHAAREAMDEGALGLSSGLFYVPGAWAEGSEINELAREVAAFGGVYATHKRSAGGRIFEAVTEAAETGLRTGVPVQISHLKVLHRTGRTEDDRMEKIIGHILSYREKGVDISWDIHPYTATNTSLRAVVIPEWISEGGKAAERLKDEGIRERIREEVAGKLAWIGGAGRIRILTSALSGKTLAEAAACLGTDPVSAAMDVVAEHNPSCLFHTLSRRDVDTALLSPHAMIVSDGGVVGERHYVHPRNFGTFPYVIGEYVRKRGLISLEEAVRKMTFMPARKFNLAGRGLIAPGMKADIVIFDPRRTGSSADFETPAVFPDGMVHVLVNGKVAWDEKQTGIQRWGEVLSA